MTAVLNIRSGRKSRRVKVTRAFRMARFVTKDLITCTGGLSPAAAKGQVCRCNEQAQVRIGKSFAIFSTFDVINFAPTSTPWKYIRLNKGNLRFSGVLKSRVLETLTVFLKNTHFMMRLTADDPLLKTRFFFQKLI